MKKYSTKSKKKKEEVKAFIDKERTKEKGKDTKKRIEKLDIRTKA